MAIIVDFETKTVGITVRDILVDRVGIILNDTDNTRWPIDELISHLNEAAAAVINRRPAAGIRRTVQQILQAGTYQLLSDDAIELIDIVRNIGDNNIAGRAIRLVDRQLLDDSDPDWHTKPVSSVIKHYTWDKRAPKVFYVYPPAQAGSKIEIIQAELPPPVETIEDTLAIDAQYIEPLVSFVLYRALSKESEFSDGNLAAAHYQAFKDALGDSNTSNDAVAPTAPGNSV